MSDTIEKIYCDPCGGNNQLATMATLMNNNNGNSQWANNPFAYLIFMMFANRLMGGNYGENGMVNPQISNLQNMMQDNHNSDLAMQAIQGNTSAIRELSNRLGCDFNTLNSAICDVRNGIDKLSGQVGFSSERVINAVNMGDCRIIEALKECCCTTQKELLTMRGDFSREMCQQTHQILDGQNRIKSAVDTGFSNIGFILERNKCDLITAGNNNTQRIIDTLNQHWRDGLQAENQDLKFKISQFEQNQYLASVIKDQCCTAK